MENVKCSQCGVETATGCAHAKCPYGDKWRETVAAQVSVSKVKSKKILKGELHLEDEGSGEEDDGDNGGNKKKGFFS